MKKALLATTTITAIMIAACTSCRSDKIGEEKAKDLALSHAGLNSDQVTFVKVEKEWEDSRQIYDVEFYTKDFTEYDYEIDAETGEILSFDSELENYTPPSQNAATSPEATEKS